MRSRSIRGRRPGSTISTSAATRCAPKSVCGAPTGLTWTMNGSNTDERWSAIDPLTAATLEVGNASAISCSSREWSAGRLARSSPSRSDNPSPCRRMVRARSFANMIRPRWSREITPIWGFSSSSFMDAPSASALASACRTRKNCRRWGSNPLSSASCGAVHPSGVTGSAVAQMILEPSGPSRRTFKPSCALNRSIASL